MDAVSYNDSWNSFVLFSSETCAFGLLSAFDFFVVEYLRRLTISIETAMSLEESN